MPALGLTLCQCLEHKAASFVLESQFVAECQCLEHKAASFVFWV
jgi:hypothetical protein